MWLGSGKGIEPFDGPAVEVGEAMVQSKDAARVGGSCCGRDSLAPDTPVHMCYITHATPV